MYTQQSVYVMIINRENAHSKPSSNPGQGCFVSHIALIPLRKVSIQLFSPDRRADLAL